jgi:hypothetical protein
MPTSVVHVYASRFVQYLQCESSVLGCESLHVHFAFFLSPVVVVMVTIGFRIGKCGVCYRVGIMVYKGLPSTSGSSSSAASTAPALSSSTIRSSFGNGPLKSSHAIHSMCKLKNSNVVSAKWPRRSNLTVRLLTPAFASVVEGIVGGAAILETGAPMAI